MTLLDPAKLISGCFLGIQSLGWGCLHVQRQLGGSAATLSTGSAAPGCFRDSSAQESFLEQFFKVMTEKSSDWHQDTKCDPTSFDLVCGLHHPLLPSHFGIY